MSFCPQPAPLRHGATCHHPHRVSQLKCTTLGRHRRHRRSSPPFVARRRAATAVLHTKTSTATNKSPLAVVQSVVRIGTLPPRRSATTTAQEFPALYFRTGTGNISALGTSKFFFVTASCTTTAVECPAGAEQTGGVTDHGGLVPRRCTSSSWLPCP